MEDDNKGDDSRKDVKQKAAFLLVYPSSAHKSVGETQSTVSMSDDEVSSVSSISLVSLLLLKGFSTEELSNDNVSSDKSNRKKKRRAKAPAFALSTVVIRSKKKKAPKKPKSTKQDKALQTNFVDVRNMRFEEDFSTKKRTFRDPVEKLKVGVESSSNSLKEMFNASKIYSSGDNVRFIQEDRVNFGASCRYLEFEDIESKLNYSRAQYDTKSRQSRKSTKSKKAKSDKPKRRKAREYEDAILLTTHPLNENRKFPIPTSSATPMRDAPIKFRSSRMLMKPDELRSIQIDDISELGSSFELKELEDDWLFDVRSVRSNKSNRSSSKILESINARVKELELLEPMTAIEPVEILAVPQNSSQTSENPTKRSFIRALSKAFRRPIDKKNVCDEDAEYLLKNFQEPSKMAKPSFGERLGRFNCEKSLRMVKESKMTSQHRGFAGLEEEMEDDDHYLPRRPRLGSADSMGKRSIDESTIGVPWNTRRMSHSTDGSEQIETERPGLVAEKNINSAKTPRRRGSLGSLGSMVLRSMAATETFTGKEKKRESTRSLEIPATEEIVIPTNRRSVRSLGSVGSLRSNESNSISGDKVNKNSKSRQKGRAGRLGGPDDSNICQARIPERNHSSNVREGNKSQSTRKPRRSPSSDKKPRKSSTTDKPRHSHSPEKYRRRSSTDKPKRSASIDKPRRNSPTDRPRRTYSVDKVKRSSSTDNSRSSYSTEIDIPDNSTDDKLNRRGLNGSIFKAKKAKQKEYNTLETNEKKVRLKKSNASGVEADKPRRRGSNGSISMDSTQMSKFPACHTRASIISTDGANNIDKQLVRKKKGRQVERT